MNSNKTISMAEKEMPKIEAKKVPNSLREDVIKNLEASGNIGIELGVAAGDFSKKMVYSGKFRKFFGVDSYSDIHDVEEYKYALSNVGIERNYNLLRMNFDDAIDLFPDNYFDFIYVDGYAHTGEEGGETIVKWFKKLKVGGVYAGDDYHEDWPLVKWAVNDFINHVGLELFITDITEDEGFSKYPSWFCIKNHNVKNITVSPHLLRLSRSEKIRIGLKRFFRNSIRKLERLIKN